MINFMKKHKFIAILRHIKPCYIEEAAKALYEGGIRIFEVTFDPCSKTTISDTQSIIKSIYSMYGDEVLVGAGTVVSPEFAKAAYKAGAKFIVSPCTDKKIISYTKKHHMLSIPGAYTPTEIVTAYNLGADIVKIFPVAPGEAGYLKNVLSPLSHIPFMVTGGINPDTIEEFLSFNPVSVAAGATIITDELTKNGEWEKITQNVKAHLSKIH